MSTTKTIAPCGGCGEPVGSVHRYPACFCHMHPFCGRAVGDEGFGQAIQCPKCDQTKSFGTTASPRHRRGPESVALSASSDSEDDKPLVIDAVPQGANASTAVAPEASAPTVATPASKRCTQVVSSIANRRKVVRWLLAYEEKNAMDGMFAKAVDHFPSVFNSATGSANLQKAID
ncbi:hypothetical protein V7S43_018982 [Phytophthora oleae]|uniref:SCAN domain-containing protein n=1 Tax=Phytophthora oleae TaxID=2107226 RepID=A0ABD3EPV3_9STRA